MPELKSAESIDRQENGDRDGGDKLHQDQQQLAIIAVHQYAAEGAKNQPGRSAAQPQDSQRHRRAGDFIGNPKKRHFLDEVADGTEQIRAPKQRVVAVAQRMKNANVVDSLCTKRGSFGGLHELSGKPALGFRISSRQGAKTPSSEGKRNLTIRPNYPTFAP